MALLYLFGESLNIMSVIGMIIVSGIMVNDAILKVDTYNRFWKTDKENKSMSEVLAQVGQIRLKPILMTSLTTILAIVPVLFTSGLGADLQFGMVLSIIGGLTLGTWLALFLIPTLYQLITR